MCVKHLCGGHRNYIADCIPSSIESARRAQYSLHGALILTIRRGIADLVWPEPLRLAMPCFSH
eukprot:14373976-Heterocapsa_arctica.AAC.1